ncbi:hypothetical protein RKD26_003156 [Streptomyces calvus]
MLDHLPALPAVGGGHLHHGRLAVEEDGRAAEPERLSRDALGGAERYVGHGLGVLHGHGAAHGEHRRLAHRRRLRVERLARLRLGDAAAQPAGARPADHRRRVPGRYVHDDLAGTVQPAGGVLAGLAHPPTAAVPRLPDERGLARVHADAFHPAVQAHGDDAAGHRRRQAEQQRVTRLRRRLEARDVAALGERPGPVGLLTGAVRGHQARQLGRQDVQLACGREHHGLVGLTARGGHLRAGGQRHRVGLRRRQPEVDLGAGRGRREETDAQQVEERGVVLVRDPVQPVQQLVHEVRERLDEGDARVGDVVVGPLRCALLHVPLRLVDELLEPPVVQVRGGQGHQSAPPSSAPGSEGIV